MKIRRTFSVLLFAFGSFLMASVAPAQTLYRANSGTAQTLRAVFFPDDSNGYIVGDSGLFGYTMHGGATWGSEQNPFGGDFYTEFFSDSANGSYAGDSGIVFSILQNNPPIAFPLAEPNAVYAMTYPSYDTGVICGANGLFYMTTDSGKTWNKKTLPDSLQKYDFHGTDYFDDDTYWLVGQDGTVLYTETDGVHWQEITVPTTKDLYSIYFPDDGSATGWIVGDSTVLTTIDGGDDWTNISTTDNLRFVEGWDSTDAYAVGLNGQIFFTANRSNWDTQPSGTAANLYGFDFTDDWLYFVGDSGIILTTLPIAQPAPQLNFEIIGNGGNNIVFADTPDDSSSISNSAMIENLSTFTITIDKMSMEGSDFILDNVPANQTPFTIDSGAFHPIEITFKPSVGDSDKSYFGTLKVYSGDSIRTAFLFGEGTPVPSSVTLARNEEEQNILLTSDARSSYITCPNNWVGPIGLEVFNLLGVSVYSTNDVLTMGANVLPSSLPMGVYIYRLSGSSGSQVGKFSLE
jgi:photosystem II stability/assembly factor-like uncharacterized protein